MPKNDDVKRYRVVDQKNDQITLSVSCSLEKARELQKFFGGKLVSVHWDGTVHEVKK